MNLRNLKSLALVGVFGLLSACTPGDGEETGGSSGDPTGNTDPTTPTTTGDPTGGEDSALCTNFGGYAGVQAVVGTFVGNVLTNESINAYFLNKAVIGDGGMNLTTCLNKQVGAAVGCGGIVYDCMDMVTAHAGMGISTADFDDLANDFVKAMDTVPTLTAEDKMTVAGVLVGMKDMIVEDAMNNVSVYQRIGRKPGIRGVIDELVGLVVADATINGFFGNADAARLTTCLVRQVTDATAGGSILGELYGNEITPPVPVDPGPTTEKPCADMKSSHASLLDPGDMKGIEFADFNALVGHLVTAMGTKGVPMTEQNAIAGALGPLCVDIVTVDPEMCPPP